jgi:hypothetical protein
MEYTLLLSMAYAVAACCGAAVCAGGRAMEECWTSNSITNHCLCAGRSLAGSKWRVDKTGEGGSRASLGSAR